MGKTSAIVFVILCLGRAAPCEPGSAPGREISLPASEVKDAFFAYVLGIVVRDQDVDLPGDYLRDILVEYKGGTSLPLERIDRVTIARDPAGGGNRIEVTFRDAVSIPIPFSILGYHPGTIRASRLVAFREPRPDRKAPASAAPAFEFRLTDGDAQLNFDEWLTFLLGNLLDDITLRQVVVFRYRGEWTGLLAGLGRRQQTIAGYFNFPQNRIIFPVPEELSAIGMVFLRPPPEK